MTVPEKGSLIVNPRTGRGVKVGGKTWRRLVKDGLIENNYRDPKELYEIKKDDDVEQKKEELDKVLPRGTHSARGRGKHKGKIVKVRNKLKADEVSKYTAKMASLAVRNNINVLAEMDNDEIELQLEKLILQEMLKKPSLKRQKTKAGKYRTKQPVKSESEESEIEESESESDGDHDEYGDWE